MKTALKTFVIFSILCLSLPATIARAEGTDIAITNVTFSSNYDTVTATLSRIPRSDERLSFNYAFYENGNVVSGGTSPLSQSLTVTTTGFRRQLEHEGINGRYDVGFAVCPTGQANDIPSPLCGPVKRESFTDSQIGDTPDIPLELWNVQQGDFARIPEGGSTILVASVLPSENPILEGAKSDQLRCVRDDSVWDSNNVSWLCTGLRGGNNTNSEIFFILNGKRSNSIVIQVDRIPQLQPRLPTQQQLPLPPNTSHSLPPAGYEDEVLVNIDTYNNPFPDTDLGELEGRAAAELYRRAIIGGFPDGKFKGDRDVNRAEAAKFLLLARYGDVSDVQNNGRFPDVLDDQWYTKYVITAANKGVINGHPDGTFRPADTVNTAEFLKMLSLTFGLQLHMPYQYTDVPSDTWFAPYAGIAENYELFPHLISRLYPERSLTRDNVSVAIYQYLQNR